MATPRSFTPLALPQPRVRDATKPITGADEGVSLRIYDLVDEGATVHIDPPLAGDLVPNDVMKLYLIGDAGPLDSTIIKAGEENSITTLHIPRGRLHPDRFNEIYFTITRGSNNIGTSTPPVTLLYNKIRPGLKDTKPEVDGHSELELLLPDIIKNGITPDFPVAGVQVCVSYPYCRAYDRIRLKCNGVDLYHTANPLEAPPPPNPGSAVPIRVCFTVTRAFLESATRPGQTLDFAYTVTDQLGNTPDTDAIWSASQTVDEDLAGTRLPAPILREQLNDTGDDAGTIELEKLKGGPLLVVILTSDNRFNVGDTLTATYTAKLTGQPDVTHEATGTVEADEFGQKKTCVLEVPNAKVIAASTVTVSFKLRPGESNEVGSRVATAKVTGQSVIDFPPPTIKQAPNNISLDPMAAMEHLTAVVDDLKRGDKIRVTWTGATGTPTEGSHTTALIDIDADGSKDIPLPNSVVAFNLGKPVVVTYSVTRGGQPAQPSKPLLLNVLTIPNEDSRFPTPSISRAQGNELDVTRLLSTDTLLIARWPFPLVSQCVWLTLRCARADGGPEEWVVWTGEAHNYEPGITQPLAYFLTWLQGCKDGATLSITFGVNLDKVANAATRVMFPVRTYTVKAIAMVDPTITSVKGSPSGVEIPDDTYTSETSFVFSGKASANQQIELRDNGVKKDTINVDGTGEWEHPLRNQTRGAHSYTVKATYGSLPESVPWTLNITRQYTVDVIQGMPQSTYIAFGNNNSRLYSLEQDTSNFNIIDAATYQLIKTIWLSYYPNNFALSPDDRRVYTTSQSSGVGIIDTTTNTLIKNISTRERSERISFSPDGTRAYVATIFGIDVINTATETVIGAIDYGEPADLKVSLDGTRLYATTRIINNSYDFAVFNTSNNALIKRIPLSSSRAWVLAITRTHAYIGLDAGIDVIDLTSNTWVKNIPHPNPDYIAASPDGASIYITYYNYVTIIDTATNRITNKIEMKYRSLGIAFTTADSTRAYVCHADDNFLSVITAS